MHTSSGNRLIVQLSLFIGLFAGALLLSPILAGATTFDNFDTYSDGDLNGQGDWTGGTNVQVQSGVVQSDSNIHSLEKYFATTSTPFYVVFDALVATSAVQSRAYVGLEYQGSNICAGGITNGNFTDTITNFSQPTLNAWYEIVIELKTNGDCTVYANGTSSTVTGGAASSSITNLKIQVGGATGATTLFDNIRVFESEYEGATTITTENCTDCTYIDSTLPVYDSLLYSTSSISLWANYKVLTEDIIDENNVYIEVEWKSAKSFIYAQTKDTNYSGGFLKQVISFDNEHYFTEIIDSLAATGTYHVDYTIYERIDPPWWQFWDSSFSKKILATDSNTFHTYQISDIGALNLEYEQQQENMALQTASQCITNGNLSQECLTERLDSGITAFLYAPPHGYITRMYAIFSATTSSSTDYDIDFYFSTTSTSTPTVMQGVGISLDLDGAIDQAISDLNTNPEFSGAYDTMFTIWNLIWYTALAFWIGRQILAVKTSEEKYD